MNLFAQMTTRALLFNKNRTSVNACAKNLLKRCNELDALFFEKLCIYVISNVNNFYFVNRVGM